MQPAHLDRLVTLSVPSLHPAGWAVVGATRPDFTSDSYTGQLWRVPLKGGEPRRITRGFRDTAPKVSPDGRVIAFLRATGPAERPQLAIVDAQGGEPHVVTDQKLGVLDFAFTPDSTRLVFVAAVPEEGRHGTLDGVDAKAEDPRRFSTLQFQLNGRGWTPDQRRHVFLLDLPDPADEPVFAPVGRAAQGSDKPKLVPEARQLTEGDFDHAEPAATNEAVVVAAARHDDRDANLRQDLYLVPFDGGEPRLLTRTAATWLEAKAPVIADGQVYFLAADIGPEGRDFVARNNAVYRVGLAGGEPVRLTDPAATDFHGLFGPAPGGEGVVGVVFDGGQGKPHLVTPDGVATPLPLPRDASAEALATAPGQPVVATVATQQSPGELAVLDPDQPVVATVATQLSPGELAVLDTGPHVVTAFGRALAEVGPAVVPQPFTAASPDGAQVHGWVFLPEGPGPHPVLLNIHGGPYYAFGPAFFDEAQVYVAAGYAVVQANPRGSAGYGEAWGQAIVGDFGNLDSVDVLSFLDQALAAFPQLDATRQGVMGGSYGGYLGAWLIAHTDRFKAAIVERGFLDPRSFIGASDIGWFFVPAYNTSDPGRMDAQSPLLLADRVTTPTLVLHSEQDLRCPLGQALRYYAELKLAGVDAELLVFPGESHELTRSGRPWHRRQRFEAVLDWWSRHLG